MILLSFSWEMSSFSFWEAITDALCFATLSVCPWHLWSFKMSKFSVGNSWRGKLSSGLKVIWRSMIYIVLFFFNNTLPGCEEMGRVQGKGAKVWEITCVRWWGLENCSGHGEFWRHSRNIPKLVGRMGKMLGWEHMGAGT